MDANGSEAGVSTEKSAGGAGIAHNGSGFAALTDSFVGERPSTEAWGTGSAANGKHDRQAMAGGLATRLWPLSSESTSGAGFRLFPGSGREAGNSEALFLALLGVKLIIGSADPDLPIMFRDYQPGKL